jgi:hypothetical protein
MTQLKETPTEELVPQSTRLLQELLVQRAKIDLLEQELATLHSLQQLTATELAKARQQMELDEEAISKAIGVLGHELELARAMAAHTKADAEEQAQKHAAVLQETIRSHEAEMSALKNKVSPSAV